MESRRNGPQQLSSRHDDDDESHWYVKTDRFNLAHPAYVCRSLQCCYPRIVSHGSCQLNAAYSGAPTQSDLLAVDHRACGAFKPKSAYAEFHLN